tara:strand:+ start:312 stop:527 length:216 start_codon:yes stop_codon:yes gene_type:complete
MTIKCEIKKENSRRNDGSTKVYAIYVNDKFLFNRDCDHYTAEEILDGLKESGKKLYPNESIKFIWNIVEGN